MEEQEISLRDLFELLLSKIWIIIIAALVGGAGAFCISKFVIAPKYSSNVSMYVKSNDNAEQKSVDYQTITASKSLVSTYIEILNNDVVMDEVAARLEGLYKKSKLEEYFQLDDDGHITAASVRSYFTMEAANETEVLRITAVTTNPKLSANLCNIMADVAPDFLIRVVGAGSVEKIGDAKVYYDKVAPSVRRYTAIGFIGFAVVAVAIIFIIDAVDNTVKDSNEMSDKYQKPIIGEIITIGGKTSKDKDGTSADRKKKLLLGNSDIPFNVVENYKSMRTNLMFSLSTYGNKVFAISSCDPSEGKSVTAANLATTLAETENKVLLIDADMRKPVQHKNFRLKNKDGLSAVLSGEKSFEQCVFRGTNGNLDILTAGVIPPNPSELIASDNMKALVEKVKAMYDYVIIDAPPILPVTDVLGLSNLIAGVLVVVRYGRTTFNELDDCTKKLSLANCNILGFVLNDIHRKHSGAYSYKYKYKYDYSYKYAESSKAGKADSK